MVDRYVDSGRAGADLAETFGERVAFLVNGYNLEKVYGLSLAKDAMNGEAKLFSLLYEGLNAPPYSAVPGVGRYDRE